MKRSLAAIGAALFLALAACGEQPVRNDREQTLDVEISSQAQISSEPTVSTYDPQETMLSSEILDLYYYQLDAIKADDAEAFLATYPPAYAEKLYPTNEDFAAYEKTFSKKASAWIHDMGEEVRLTLTVIDEQLTDKGDADAYTQQLDDRYGIKITVQDTRKFTFEYALTGADYSYTYDPVTAVAIKVDDHWYLPPGETLFSAVG